MNILLIILATGAFGSMVSIMFFKRIVGMKTSERFRQLTLLLMMIEVTVISLLGNPEQDLYSRVNLWGLLMAVPAFFLTINYIIKDKTKEIYLWAGILTASCLVSVINAIANGYWDEVYNFYALSYMMDLYIFIIITAVKRNQLAFLAGRIIIAVYAVSTLARAAFSYTGVVAFTIEIIFFGFLGVILAIPLLLVVSKRFPGSLPRSKSVADKNNIPLDKAGV